MDSEQHMAQHRSCSAHAQHVEWPLEQAMCAHTGVATQGSPFHGGYAAASADSADTLLSVCLSSSAQHRTSDPGGVQSQVNDSETWCGGENAAPTGAVAMSALQEGLIPQTSAMATIAAHADVEHLGTLADDAAHDIHQGAGVICCAAPPPLSMEGDGDGPGGTAPGVYAVFGKEAPSDRIHVSGRWSDFGGHGEAGETPEMTAAREFFEESMGFAAPLCGLGPAGPDSVQRLAEMLREGRYCARIDVCLNHGAPPVDGRRRRHYVTFVVPVPWDPSLPERFARARADLMRVAQRCDQARVELEALIAARVRLRLSTAVAQAHGIAALGEQKTRSCVEDTLVAPHLAACVAPGPFSLLLPLPYEMLDICSQVDCLRAPRACPLADACANPLFPLASLAHQHERHTGTNKLMSRAGRALRRAKRADAQCHSNTTNEPNNKDPGGVESSQQEVASACVGRSATERKNDNANPNNGANAELINVVKGASSSFCTCECGDAHLVIDKPERNAGACSASQIETALDCNPNCDGDSVSPRSTKQCTTSEAWRVLRLDVHPRTHRHKGSSALCDSLIIYLEARVQAVTKSASSAGTTFIDNNNNTGAGVATRGTASAVGVLPADGVLSNTVDGVGSMPDVESAHAEVGSRNMSRSDATQADAKDPLARAAVLAPAQSVGMSTNDAPSASLENVHIIETCVECDAVRRDPLAVAFIRALAKVRRTIASLPEDMRNHPAIEQSSARYGLPTVKRSFLEMDALAYWSDVHIDEAVANGGHRSGRHFRSPLLPTLAVLRDVLHWGPVDVSAAGAAAAIQPNVDHARLERTPAATLIGLGCHQNKPERDQDIDNQTGARSSKMPNAMQEAATATTSSSASSKLSVSSRIASVEHNFDFVPYVPAEGLQARYLVRCGRLTSRTIYSNAKPMSKTSRARARRNPNAASRGQSRSQRGVKPGNPVPQSCPRVQTK